MANQGCLSNPKALLVADASVAINLLATGISTGILQALPNRLVLTETVQREIEQGGHNGTALSALVRGKHVDIVQLSDDGLEYFYALVSGSAAQTLDDGEAATIAYALENSATALIDEKKAIRICGDEYANLATGCSVDIFMHNSVKSWLGKKKLGDAVYCALHHAHMRVLPHHVDWVVNTIGPSRAAQCPSLPWTVRKRLMQR